MTEIALLLEHRPGRLHDSTGGLLTLGRHLADAAGTSLTAWLPGVADEAAAAGIRHHVDRLVLLRSDALSGLDSAVLVDALARTVSARAPRLLMMSHTPAAMDVAPVLAMRCGIPLVGDCVALRWRDDGLHADRQVYGGKALEKLSLKPAATWLATIRPGSGDATPAEGEPATIETCDLSAPGDVRGRRLLGHRAVGGADIDIGEADFIVAVGRGVGKAERVADVQKFADAIGATLACSRPVADKGWLAKTRQVGTSGRSVRPRVYLAMGISGAYQHVAGMSGADTIIAVNTDASAPIFDVASVGIVADMFEIMPALQRELTST